jgi:hypothetical protein
MNYIIIFIQKKHNCHIFIEHFIIMTLNFAYLVTIIFSISCKHCENIENK